MAIGLFILLCLQLIDCSGAYISFFPSRISVQRRAIDVHNPHYELGIAATRDISLSNTALSATNDIKVIEYSNYNNILSQPYNPQELIEYRTPKGVSKLALFVGKIDATTIELQNEVMNFQITIRKVTDKIKGSYTIDDMRTIESSVEKTSIAVMYDAWARLKSESIIHLHQLTDKLFPRSDVHGINGDMYSYITAKLLEKYKGIFFDIKFSNNKSTTRYDIENLYPLPLEHVMRVMNERIELDEFQNTIKKLRCIYGQVERKRKSVTAMKPTLNIPPKTMSFFEREYLDGVISLLVFKEHPVISNWCVKNKISLNSVDLKLEKLESIFRKVSIIEGRKGFSSEQISTLGEVLRRSESGIRFFSLLKFASSKKSIIDIFDLFRVKEILMQKELYQNKTEIDRMYWKTLNAHYLGDTLPAVFTDEVLEEARNLLNTMSQGEYYIYIHHRVVYLRKWMCVYLI